MPNYISIDGGTTNTRICLVVDGKITESKKYNIGASAGLEGRELLKSTVSEGISQILRESNLTEGNISRILASGMITSEFGLYLLPHGVIPAGIKDLKAASQEVILPEISSIPFVFMRGLKTACETLETADMMRGEETELMGIIDPRYGKSVYALMGSHTKIIKTSEDGLITDFVTFLTGELSFAVSQNTILKNCFSRNTIPTDSEYLLKGYEYCRSKGINEALFKTRILKNLFDCTEEQAYSFFFGAVLCNDAEYVLGCDVNTVVVAGNEILKQALTTILKEKSSVQIVTLSEQDVANSVTKGQISIYETKM